MDEYRIHFEDQHVSLHVFINEFNRRFKKEPGTRPYQAILFSRDITTRNDWLTKETNVMN